MARDIVVDDARRVTVSVHETGVRDVYAVKVIYDRTPGSVGRTVSFHFEMRSFVERLSRLGIKDAGEIAEGVWLEFFGDHGMERQRMIKGVHE